MSKVALLYSSHNGQTLKIAQAIQKQINGGCCELFDLHQKPQLSLEHYNMVIIGAAIRYGHFDASLYRFIKDNQQHLSTMPSAFFGVNLTARKPGKDIPEGNAYIQTFLKKSSWQPKLVDVFAGALNYSQYNWWQTLLIQMIMKMTGGSTDSSRDIEFTNWQRVQSFAANCLQMDKTT
ncbi:menaquinone-dependent protoporphyrinogen IX dehydrogenase [Dongshaea marina]|uniref:menaquinone-dependent protoporphyrinogen IX dehydrogenase n=1 Tax=Dongshaea marina TaxID=2047966 RepID=UPI000D3E094B|nr:menaquinone-dependent protoporphyrinogen IX dehydrogenase [Dongshaea marina]